MTTTDLAIALREVINAFVLAELSLRDGDLAEYKARYGKAMRELDAYQDRASSSSL